MRISTKPTIYRSALLTNPSPLYFGYDIAAQFSQKLDEAMGDQPADKIFLVADAGVYAAHDFGRSLLEARPNVELILIEPGEAFKSWAGLEGMCERLASKGASKRLVAVAFGLRGKMFTQGDESKRVGCRVNSIDTGVVGQFEIRGP
jgi:3-dehydroquinate synthetase